MRTKTMIKCAVALMLAATAFEGNAQGVILKKTDGTSYRVSYSDFDCIETYTAADEEAEAIDALKAAFAEGGTYKLERSLTLSETLTLAGGLELSLDLNGYTLTNPVEAAPSIVNNGTLTITGGSLVNGNTAAQRSAVIQNYGTLTLDNVTVGSDTNRGAAVENKDGKTTVNGGTYNTMDRGHSSNGYAYVFINYEGEIEINNATSEGCPNGLFYAYAGTINVNGGTYSVGDGEKVTWYVAYAETGATINLNSGTYTWQVPSWNTIDATTGNVVVSEDCVINWTIESEMVKALKQAATTGGTIELTENVELTAPLHVTADLVIDLGEYTITGSGITNDAVICADGASVTVKGDGTITTTGAYPLGVRNGGTLTVEGGNFEATNSTQAVYVWNGTAYIKGGYFNVDSQWNGTGYFDENGNGKFVLNCKDSAYASGDANIVVSGGSFYKFDPANNVAESEGTNFLADGYATICSDNVYTVYTLSDAVSKASSGDVITFAGTVSMPSFSSKTLTFVGADEDATIKLESKYVTLSSANVTFKNLVIDHTSNENYVGFAHTSSATYENCTIKGKIFLYAPVEKFTKCKFYQTAVDYNVWTYGADDVTFTDCDFYCEGKSVLIYEENSAHVEKVTLNGCTLTANNPANDGKAAVEIACSHLTTGFYTVYINNTTSIGFDEGSKSGSDLWNIKNGSRAIVYVDGDDAVNTIKIATKQELFDFANDVNVNGNSYSGKTVVLTADIDLAGEEWTPVGQTGGNGAATYFQGTFDGKNKTISNLKISQNDTYAEAGTYATGLFGFIDMADAKVQNLTIDKADVTGNHWTAAVVGYLTGTINNCHVTNSTVVCNHVNSEACGDKAGTIVGFINNGLVTKCSATDCSVSAARNAGQLVGATNYSSYVDTDSCSATRVSVSTINDGCPNAGADVNEAIIGRIVYE